MNVESALKIAQLSLHQSSIPESLAEARSLTALAIDKDKTFLIAHPEYELSNAEERKLTAIVQRRANREPLQYIRGTQEFFGLNFDISPTVLIPRPETELLVEKAIAILSGTRGETTFLEIGVGSGCISVSILVNHARARGLAGDVSEEAIAVAYGNATKYGVTDRLDLSVSDVYGSFGSKAFDLIASNPPYIRAEDLSHLQPEVRDYEPRVALTDGHDGLSIIRRIVADAHLYLKDSGELLVEIGFDQAAEVEKMFDPEIWREVTFLNDLQGIRRIVSARLR